MSNKNVTLQNEEKTDNLYPITKIGNIEGGGSFFDATKELSLGLNRQIPRINESGTGIEWVDPYNSQTVISDEVVSGDTQPVSGGAVYNFVTENVGTSYTEQDDLSGYDVDPGLYSIDVSNAVFPSDFSMEQKQFVVSAEIYEDSPLTIVNPILSHRELAISNGSIAHYYDLVVYYCHDAVGSTTKTLYIELYIDGVLVTSGGSFTNGVKIRKLLGYATVS